MIRRCILSCIFLLVLDAAILGQQDCTLQSAAKKMADWGSAASGYTQYRWEKEAKQFKDALIGSGITLSGFVVDAGGIKVEGGIASFNASLRCSQVLEAGCAGSYRSTESFNVSGLDRVDILIKDTSDRLALDISGSMRVDIIGRIRAARLESSRIFLEVVITTWRPSKVREEEKLAFVTIPAGKFMMGCSPGDSGCDGDENPRHEVTISRSFELGKHEGTQAQWIRLMGNNPSSFSEDDRHPVANVSWNDALAFVAKLNTLNDGYRYRLPTEAEWEYAARGGTTGLCYGDLDAIGWYDANSAGRTHPVGQKQPNGFGLYDMLGNVWEWCSDWYGEGYYGSSPAADPRGPSTGQNRVLRGGSWLDFARLARVSVRLRYVPDLRLDLYGFRVCREKL